MFLCFSSSWLKKKEVIWSQTHKGYVGPFFKNLLSIFFIFITTWVDLSYGSTDQNLGVKLPIYLCLSVYFVYFLFFIVFTYLLIHLSSMNNYYWTIETNSGIHMCVLFGISFQLSSGRCAACWKAVQCNLDGKYMPFYHLSHLSYFAKICQINFR